MENILLRFILQNNLLLGVLFFGSILLFCIIYILSSLLFSLRNIHKRHVILTIRFPEISDEETGKYRIYMENVFDGIFSKVKSPIDKVFFEIIKSGEYITIQIGSNKEHILDHVKQSFLHLPGIEITKTSKDELEHLGNMYINSIYTSESFYPVNKNEYIIDSIINILSGMQNGEQGGVQFILRGVSKKFAIQKKIFALEGKVEKKRLLTDSSKRKALWYAEKMDENLFKTKIYVFSSQKHHVSSLSSLFSSLNFNTNVFYSQRGLEFLMRKRFIAPDSLFTEYFSFLRQTEGSYFTSSELSAMIHPARIARGVYAPKQVREIEAIPLLLEESDDNIVMGIDGKDQTFHFPIRNFERHIYSIGKTGRGKSTLLVTLLKGLHKKTDGNIWVIDPHGDMVKDTISNLEDRKNTYYLDIRDNTRVFTINPLFAFRKSPSEKASLKDIVLDIIKRETEEQTGGYQSGSMTQNRIEQLIELALEFPDAYFSFLLKKGVNREKAERFVRERQISLNDLPYLLVAEYNYLPLLRLVFTDVTSSAGRYVLRQMASHQGQQLVVEAVQSRLKQLLHSSLQYIFEGNTFAIEDAIDSKNTFLIPMQRSVFGTRGTHIFMQVLFSLLWHYKQGKEETDRKNTYLFIDEFQNAQIKDIPEIIAEGRKYKFFLTLSNQQLGILFKPIKDAILGNIGTIFSFAVGADEIGAKTLAPYFGQSVTEKDLTMLPLFQAYVKTEGSKEKPSVTFSFATIPLPYEENNQTVIDSITRKTLKKYGEKRSVLEDRLNRKQENPLKYFTEGIL